MDLLEKAGFSQVIVEPIIKESNDDGYGGLRADWSARGFWDSQREALFDVRIFNADAPSYQTKSLEALFNAQRTQKKKTYCEAAEARRGSFTPVIATCEGVFDREAVFYLKRLAFHLSEKWNMHTSQVKGWVKARMQVCILRSVSLCIRGSRTKWRGAGVEDRAALTFCMQ